MSYEIVELSELIATRTGSVDPAKFPNEEFELFSIPAFDAGFAEIKRGNEIGSSKQCVAPGDVLLSKIVPHIRRAWIVGPTGGRRQIASSEWIVFRGDRIHAKYLRQVLVGDVFHAMFMNTVAGVGGSLLRARPAHVAKIHVPLPPLSEQNRIAEILDRAESLRRQRRAALALLDELTQSTFLDMFGDPSEWPTQQLKSVARDGDRINYGIVQPGHNTDGGVPMVRICDFDGMRVDKSKLVRVDQAIEAKHHRSRLLGNEVLFGCVGSIGEVALADSTMAGFNINRAVIRIPLSKKLTPLFLAHYLQSPHAMQYFRKETRTGSQVRINTKQLEELQVPIPPEPRQRNFAKIAESVEQQKSIVEQQLAELDSLTASLQHRAFRGEL